MLDELQKNKQINADSGTMEVLTNGYARMWFSRFSFARKKLKEPEACRMMLASVDGNLLDMGS
jgi:hypothetical protein